MIVDFAGRLLYPQYHQWTTNDLTIKKLVGDCFTVTKATSLDSRLQTFKVSKNNTQVRLVLLVKNVKRALVVGSVADINNVFLHEYNHSLNDDPNIVRAVRLNIIETLFVQSSVNETQLYNAFKTKKVGGVGLIQGVSFALIERCKKDVERLCKFVRAPKNTFTIDCAINQKLKLNYDIVLINKQYKQQQLFQKDQLLLRDRRFSQTIAQKQIYTTLINSRIDQRMLIPIQIGSKHSDVCLIDDAHSKKYSTYFTQRSKSIQLQSITFDSSLSKPTLVLSNRVTIKFDDDNVIIRGNNRSFNMRLSLFKTVLNQAINIDGLNTYKTDVERYKTILTQINDSLKASSINVEGTINTIGEVGNRFMELSEHDQYAASAMINMINHLMLSTVDNQSIMWDYIISLPDPRKAIKHLQL